MKHTDFFKAMVCQALENVILSRHVFHVNDEQLAKFIEMLGRTMNELNRYLANACSVKGHDESSHLTYIIARYYSCASVVLVSLRQ